MAGSLRTNDYHLHWSKGCLFPVFIFNGEDGSHGGRPFHSREYLASWLAGNNGFLSPGEKGFNVCLQHQGEIRFYF